MQITCTRAFEFQLDNHFNVPLTGYISEDRNLVLKSCRVFPAGGVQTIPDSVSFNPLFVTALAAGQVTIADEPAGVVTLDASETSSNVELPQTGENVVVYNPGPTDICVLLGNSDVVVSATTGIVIFPGSAVILPLADNTYLAGIALGSTPITISIAVE